MQNSLKRQDSIREETEPKDDKNQSQDVSENNNTAVVNGYRDSTSSECQDNKDNTTIIAVDYNPASNSETSTAMQEKKTTVGECTAEVVQACDESNVFVVQEETAEFCCVETVAEEHSAPSSRSSMSDDAGSSVAFTEAVVQDCSEAGSVACAAELVQEDVEICELVECTDTSPNEFQVASVVECDDTFSVCSLGSSENIAQTHEIVMECGEQLVEEVPLNPVQKALIRRGYCYFLLIPIYVCV